MNIVQSADQWTRVTTTIEARFWDGYLWRKEYSSDYFGGYRILKVGRTTQLAREWLFDWDQVYATCSKEIADWLDPNGDLRRAGLLFS